MRFIEPLDANLVPIGEGPLINTLGASVTETLDQAGEFNLTLPATDARLVGILSAMKRVRVKVDIDGVIQTYYGLLENDETAVTDTAPACTLTGTDLLGELGHFTCGWWAPYINESIAAQILPDLARDTGWSLGALDGDLGNYTGRFDGMSRLAAIIALRDSTGKHFRMGTTPRTLDFGALNADSGLVISNVQAFLVDQALPIIGSLRYVRDRAPIINRIVPWGAGQDNGDSNRAKVSLFYLPAGSPAWANIHARHGLRNARTLVTEVGAWGPDKYARYSVASTAGFMTWPVMQLMWCVDPNDLTQGLGFDFAVRQILDATTLLVKGSGTIPPPAPAGATLLGMPQLYIQDDAAYAADPREATVVFDDIQFTDDFPATATQLYTRAMSYLADYKEAREGYTLTVLNSVPTLHVGQKARLIFRGVVSDDAGRPLKWVDIDRVLYVTKVTRQFNADGTYSSNLDVSNIARQPVDDAAFASFSARSIDAVKMTAG